MISLESRLKDHARALGFELVGIAPALEADGFAHLQSWLAQGFAGEMEYMSRHADAHRHPDAILPNVRSVVMVGINYKQESGIRNQESGSRGRVSCYAGGMDYHDVLREKLKRLLAWLQEQNPSVREPGGHRHRPAYGSRDFARRAGLGWFGKNTMLID